MEKRSSKYLIPHGILRLTFLKQLKELMSTGKTSTSQDSRYCLDICVSIPAMKIPLRMLYSNERRYKLILRYDSKWARVGQLERR